MTYYSLGTTKIFKRTGERDGGGMTSKNKKPHHLSFPSPLSNFSLSSFRLLFLSFSCNLILVMNSSWCSSLSLFPSFPYSHLSHPGIKVPSVWNVINPLRNKPRLFSPSFVQHSVLSTCIWMLLPPISWYIQELEIYVYPHLFLDIHMIWRFRRRKKINHKINWIRNFFS